MGEGVHSNQSQALQTSKPTNPKNGGKRSTSSEATCSFSLLNMTTDAIQTCGCLIWWHSQHISPRSLILLRSPGSDPKKHGHFHFQLEITKGALSSMLLLFPRGRSCLEGVGEQGFTEALAKWVSFSVSLILFPFPSALPPNLPMTCSATKHSEIFYSSFSECVFRLDTQTKNPFHSKVKKKYVPWDRDRHCYKKIK